MTYTINNYDGTPLVSVADQTFDTTATPLTLVGRANLNYGMMFNQNLVNLLENFSRSTAPDNPLLGMLWYDKGNGVLKIKDANGFEPLATQSYGGASYVGSASSGAQPLTVSGDAAGTMGLNTTPFNVVLDVFFPVTSVNGTTGAANVSYSNITGYAPDLYPSQDGDLSVANTLTVGTGGSNSSIGEIDFGSSGATTKIAAAATGLSFQSNGSGAMTLDNQGGLTVTGAVNAKAGTFFLGDTSNFVSRFGTTMNFVIASATAMSLASSGDLSLSGNLYLGASTASVGTRNGSLTLTASGGTAATFTAGGILTVPGGVVVQGTSLVAGVSGPCITSYGAIAVQSGGITSNGAIAVQAGGLSVVGDVHGFGSGIFDGNLTSGSGVLNLNFAPGSTVAEVLLGYGTNTKIYFDDDAHLSFSCKGGNPTTLDSAGNLAISGAIGTVGAANIGGGAVIAGDIVAQDGTLYLGTTFGEIIFGGQGSTVKIDYDAGSKTVWCSNGGNAAIITTSTASDEKLKKNVSAHDDALSLLRKVDVVNFEYRKDSGYHDGKRHVGFLAQQLADLVPVAVQEGRGMLHVNKQELVPHLVRAVQQLSEQNAALMARLEALEARPAA